MDSDNVNEGSLIVNYLPKDFTEEDLRILFSEIGPVKGWTLMRDHAAQISLGYGFVNFTTKDDAQMAIDKLNGLRIDNKIIKVSYARPCCEATKGTNIYVAGLPFSTTDDQLLNIYANYGRIIDHKIITPQINLNSARCAALIRYGLRSEALSAIEETNGKTLPGFPSPLTVKFAHNPKLRLNRSFSTFIPFNKMNPHSNDQTHVYPLFIFNLHSNTEEKDLWKLFGPFGAIKGVRVVTEKGFGFVNMLYRSDAENAVRALNGSNFRDRIIQVSFKSSRPRH